MHRRLPRSPIALGVTLLSVGLGSACLWRSATRGPVIIYLVDTLRYDRMSAYGAKRPTSPAAERLAKEGVRYDTAYSVASWTRPAVASLFTSRWPAEVGALGRGGTLSTTVLTIAEAFRASGWATAAFCGQPSIYLKQLGFRQGFETFDSVAPNVALDAGVTTADRVVDPAIGWIRARTDPRFFLYVHVVDPHNNGWNPGHEDPYRHWLAGYENLYSRGVPEDLMSRDWRLSKYDALIRQADDQFSRLRNALESKHWWKSALVIYVADHGEEFREHGGWYHGHSLFEELVHIPLIVKAPGWRRPGEVEKAPVTILDLLPSIADWASLPKDAQWRGQAIDREKPHLTRAVYLSEELENFRLYGIRRGSRKMIASLNPPFRVQFDIERDPGEQSPVETDGRLVEVLEAYRAAEVTSYGGLRIRKVGSEPASIRGFVELGASPVPYLTLTDRVRFPIDPRRRDELPVSAEIGDNVPFDLHLESLGGGPELMPHLAVAAAGGARRQIPASFVGRVGPLQIVRGAASELSGAEMAEVVRSMRALGYLGGGDH